ncbi:MAG: MATE family efflux transporter [Spirochaetes bacterium]|nr:MATE family efflux transporter [Spirochaetota bacterium]MBU1078861.1 MATE family efflux transporter [Spirochaetota bacterium]
MHRDLTKGSVVGNLLAMSVPTMFGMLGQTLYDVVDMIWIGRISGEAVAGVALFSSIFWLVEVLNEVIGVSSVAMITQSFGAGDEPRTARVVEQTIVFKAFMAVIAALVLFVALEPLVRFFSSDPAVVRSALEYGRIRIFFLPLFFATYSCFTALRCTGDPGSQMWIMLGASVLNTILDPLLMFETVPGLGIRGLGLGVFGAGLATVISITVAFAVGFGLLASGRTRVRLSLAGLFRLDPAIDHKLLSIGLPSGGEMLARQIAGLVTTKFVAFYGTAAIAALGIGNRLGGLVFMPLFGLMSGGGTIVGQNLGAENPERAERTARAASLLGGFAITALMGLAIAFPRSVMGVFVDSAETIEVGVSMIRLMGGSFIVVSFAIALGCAFSGSGYNLPFLVSSLAGRWGAQIPFLALSVYVFPRFGLNLGIHGIWASFLVSDAVEALILVLYYRRGDWKKVRV